MKREIAKYSKMVERWRVREAKYKGDAKHAHFSKIAGIMADALEEAIAGTGPMVEAHEAEMVKADALRMKAEEKARKAKKAENVKAEKKAAAEANE